ncbi:WYL domain-containing protein [Dysgonomonas sp. 521]|uniref:helix-turn-helix transcriptional regulator n=1 Tax=Dysgonomonas sp. 521 TaxID=2302932 RepID=UPI0013CFAEFB|nr:WYL domain-containing protein [Dysgonomonas sp. 521]NDV97199.1 WYL domain-containing protein [Dysgonomonas sp. 521]
MPRIHHLQRNLLIISKIRNTPYVSFAELTAHLERELMFRGIYDTGLSRRTIQRDIQNIRTDFSIDIEYCRRNQGYYIADSDIRSDIDRFLDSFDILSSLNTETGIPDFVLAEKHRPMGTQYLYPLIHAIKNSFRITFSYQKFGSEQSSFRELEPYAVKECRGRWYVIGSTRGLNDLKTYGLDRIKNLIISDEIFPKDDAIDVSEKFRYSFGIYSSDEYPVEDVILSFDASDGSYLKSLPLHHSQEIITDNKDGFVIKLRLKITADFVMEIMSRSWSLKVIEPLSLREQIYSICKSALERNDITSY